MIELRKSADRGHLNFGWLDTFHTFSFGEYHDPRFMGFRDLRVINEDRVAQGRGFGTHSHQNMEIITYMVGGELTHKDSMGNGASILPGEIQYMSAGSGVTHSEFNNSKEVPAHLLQIWILPNQKDGEPRYNQKTIALANRKNRLYRMVGNDGSGAPIEIHQDVSLYGCTLDPQIPLKHELADDRHAWIQVVDGHLEVNGYMLTKGDGAAVSEEKVLTLKAHKTTEFLLFDLS